MIFIGITFFVFLEKVGLAIKIVDEMVYVLELDRGLKSVGHEVLSWGIGEVGDTLEMHSLRD